MKVFVIASLEYDPPFCQEFPDRAAALAWMNAHTNHTIEKVIEGREIFAKPVEVVKQYKLDDRPGN